MEKNLEKINNEIEKIKSEIKEIGFSIYEVPSEKRKKYFYELKKKVGFKFLNLIFVYFLGFLLVFFISLFYILDDFGFLGALKISFWGFNFFFFPFLLFYLFFGDKLENFGDEKNFENLSGIRNQFVIFTEKYVLINFEIYKYKNFEDKKILKIFEKDNFFGFISKRKMEDLELKIYMFNSKNRRIFSLEENFLNIYFFAGILEEKQEKFEKLFKEDELFLKFSKIEKNFLEITENIENCISSQKDFLKILQKIGKKDFINFEKYDLWLKNNLLLPLKNMKNILENHKNFIEKLLEENKENKSEQILVLNKRLELQKETLAKNILILDGKILKLEK